MSDPHGVFAENFPNLHCWWQGISANLHYAAAGMVSARDSVNPADWLKIVVGVIGSALASSYVTAERTAIEVKQYAAIQSEFRAEMRQFMREQAADTAALRDRLARIEAITYPNGHAPASLSAKVPK